ncbi:apoptotic protease-activating factor 1 [Caerostris extrusa]|uniref:Apoptotic protease-activating factor 1 n=1 Tax=Caerostris extrusa TaxID=172846 RepID=A0AAV4VPT7_CAEEX|nr:apoptotic protease-activating factor 1 [Caerostris extrusa]
MEYKNEEKIFCYSIHEIFLLGLEKHIEHTDDIQKRHKKLVEKILKFCELPDGSYDWKKLPEHYIPFTIKLKQLYQIFFYYENDEAEMFKSFLKRNKIALMKGNDIIQLALFERNDSIVYKKAKDYASTINNAKYFDWYNKEGNNPSLFSCRTVNDFVGIKHAVFNNDASLIAVVGKSFVTIQEKILAKNHNFVACGSEVKIFKIGESLISSGEFSKKRLSIPNIQQSNKPELLDIDKSILSFNEHNSEVVCCSYSHDDLHIISSDSSEKTYVWEVCTEPKPYWLIKHSIKILIVKDLRFSCF